MSQDASVRNAKYATPALGEFATMSSSSPPARLNPLLRVHDGIELNPADDRLTGVLARDQMDRAEAVARFAKRAIDVAGASVGLVCLAPVMFLVALLIRLESRGPILFRQRRMGRNGRIFWCLKFRTMVPDAEKRLKEIEHLNESAGGVLFKIKRDPRVTPLGSFLRRASLDELPQLVNVVVGDMSLVGPRPLQLRDCSLLEEIEPEGFVRRLQVPPGVTGPWQVGGRSEASFERMLALDLGYIENWSLTLDLQILLKTVAVVLKGRGAS
jgi:lipopolysaccharide/colanic/teichoic acid biosynthesis glycosyltransferase